MPPKKDNDSFTTISATGGIDGNFDIYFVDASGGNITITLPATADVLLGRVLTFKRIDSSTNTVTINRTAPDTIDGGTAGVVLEVDDIVLLIRAGPTAWRSMNFEGSSTATLAFTTFTATTVIDSTNDNFDLYIINNTAGADITITLPAASTQTPGRTFRFRRIDTNDDAVTIAADGTAPDDIQLTNNTAASTTINAADILLLTRTSTTRWTSVGSRPNILTINDTAAATPVAVNTNFDVWASNTAVAVTYNLPSIAGPPVIEEGRKLHFTNYGAAANALTLTPNGADTISGAATLVLTDGTGATLVSDGVAIWFNV